MPRNVIIVGMARSGTSLTASIFARKGYAAALNPDVELQSGNKFNPGGYWESSQLIDANVSILRRAGFDNHNTWTSHFIDENQAESIYSLSPESTHRKMIENYESRRPWLMKDPRFCFTLGYWWPMIRSTDTGVLLLTRSPEEIHRSFLRLNWRPDLFADRSSFLQCVDQHIVSARRCLKRLDIPHIEIDYADYAEKPNATAAQISGFFDLSLTATDLGYNRKLNHSSSHGSVEFWAEKLIASLPLSARRFLKRITPRFLQRLFAPSRR